MEIKPILQIKNLTTEFYSEGIWHKVIEDIDLTLGEGEVLGIAGESGSGKSVTSLSIMRLIPYPQGRISQGSILYQKDQIQIDLRKYEEAGMQNIRGKDIAMIFQEPMSSLNPVILCGKQVCESILVHQKISKTDAKKKVIELFEEVQLPDPARVFNSYPHQISGGQKQRVMIAMALSCQPKILIADEPTTALDVTVQKAIIELLQKLREQRKLAIIFITHDLAVLSGIADQVAIMYKGKIVEAGTKHKVFNNSQHEYTKALLSCRPSADFRPNRLKTIDDILGKNEIQNDSSLTEDKTARTKRLAALYSPKPMIEVKYLCKFYYPDDKRKPVFKAVNNVSFEIFKGETLGLVGESGCGKTTLGRTLLNLIEPTRGEVFLNGEALYKKNKSEWKGLRKRMQIIFQDPYSSLNPRKTIGQAILEPIKVHRMKTANGRLKVIEMLEKVGLSEAHFNRFPHEFSGGQRQRVCIARALIVEPEFVVCDESVSALDVSVQAQVLNLLNQLKTTFDLTYLFISHDLNVVKYMSDRIMVMKNGSIIELQEADELYHNPKNPYTRKLIESIPKLEV